MLKSILRNQLNILMIATLLVAAVGGVSVVWMRQKVMVTAQHCRYLEIERLQVDRKNTFLASKIAQAHTPEFLKHYRASNLQTPIKNQVVWVQPRKTAEPLTLPNQQPFMIAFNLALLQDMQ